MEPVLFCLDFDIVISTTVVGHHPGWGCSERYHLKLGSLLMDVHIFGHK